MKNQKLISTITNNHLKFIVLILLCIGFNFNTKAQSYEWAKSFGGSNNDYGYGIATDASGNIYVTGSFRNTVDFDPNDGTENITSSGSDDIFILKLDISGNLVWVKTIGSSSSESGRNITLDASGNVYITGEFSGTVDFDPGTGAENLTSNGGSNIFVLKLDANGNYIWAKNIGGANGQGIGDIVVDASGNIYTTGYFFGTGDFDPDTGTANLTSNGSEDIFILKLDVDGNYVWAKSIGGSSEDYGNGIALDGAGNVYTTGYSEGGADFDPGAGTVNFTHNGNYDIFILKLDSDGNYVWAKSIGGSGDDSGGDITLDASGNVYTTGRFRSSTIDLDPGTGVANFSSNGDGDIFILKLDSDGNYVWAKSFGSSNSETISGLVLDNSGNIYTTGSFSGTADFDPGSGIENLSSAGSFDAFVLKLDASGNYVWAKNMGGTSNDFSRAIAVDASDNVYTTGYFQGTADFDPNAGIENLSSNGNRDVFVSKLSRPTLTISTTTLSDLNATILNASDTQTFTISGSNLATDVSISSSTTDWELSTDNTNFSATLSLSQSGGVLTGQPLTVYVRLKSGLSLGAKTATLSISSMHVTTQNITLNGTVNKDDQIITFEALSIKIIGEADFDLTATASSGLDIAYTSSNTAVATISGSTVSIVGIGTSEITASQVGNDSYNAATDVTQILTVTTLTSLSNLENQIIKTYPNPTAGKLIIENLPAGQVTFSLSDTRGSEIFRGVAEKSLELDLSKLPAGVYTLTLDTNEGSFGSKVLKQ